MKAPAGLELPRSLDDVDASFLTELFRARGVIAGSNTVVSTEESDVGMTAGYFSSIKRVKCQFQEPTDAQDSYIVKAWPEFEIAPGENIAAMFAKDIQGYMIDADRFYPRPRALLADFDADKNRWALVMEDACTFSEQKLHEKELDIDEVMRMIPKMVDIAVAWEGCHEGEKARTLNALNAGHWADDSNLATFRELMPGGAAIYDHLWSRTDSDMITGRPWNEVPGPGFYSLFTRKLDAYYAPMHPERGATCTLSHGDLRGDNLFFCEPTPDYPDGWLTIDYQLMFRGPVPSDLAYLMNSGSVLPDVYSGPNRDRVLRAFYDQFMSKTVCYPDYSWDQFLFEYSTMAATSFTYCFGFGTAIMKAGLENEQPARVELGDKGETEADLTPAERRQRMWWRKAFANFQCAFDDFGHYERLSGLPDNKVQQAEWFELPERLLR